MLYIFVLYNFEIIDRLTNYIISTIRKKWWVGLKKNLTLVTDP